MMGRTQNRQVIVKRSVKEVTRTVSELFNGVVGEAVGQRGVCNLALAGGTTPHALYQHLAGVATSDEVPWRDVEIFFGDERDVPQDHVESNYRMVQRTLLDNVPVPPSRVHPMRGDAEDLDEAAAEYEQTIRQVIPAGKDGIPRFDLILLGMGGDGHTVSLFPYTDALSEKQKLVTVCFVPVLGRRRMTFTFPLINAAENVILMVTGDDKAEAAAAVFSDDPQAARRLPAANIAPHDGSFIVVLDAAAARASGLRPD